MFFPLQHRPRQCHGRGDATSKATPRAQKVGTDRRIGTVLPTPTGQGSATATAMPRQRQRHVHQKWAPTGGLVLFFPLKQRQRQCHAGTHQKWAPTGGSVLFFPLNPRQRQCHARTHQSQGAGPSRCAGGSGRVMSPPSRTLSGAADDHPNPQISIKPITHYPYVQN